MRLTYNFLIILPLLSNFSLILTPDLTIPIFRLLESKEFKKWTGEMPEQLRASHL